MTTTTIQRAQTQADIDFIAEHFEATIALFEPYEVSPDSIAKRRVEVTEWIASEHMHITVAVRPDGRPVGFNTIHLTADYCGRPLGKILILFVHPEHPEHRDQGATEVLTEIDAQNQRMLDINRRAGFELKSYVLTRKL